MATGLGALVGVYLFIPPIGSLWLATQNNWMRLAVFLAEGLVISYFCKALNSARRQAQAHALDALTKQRRRSRRRIGTERIPGGIAHELRNPLATIGNALTLARMPGADSSSLQW